VNPPGEPYDLQRFVTAQDACLGQVRAELRAGRKTSHWMWFIFPQIAGLGRSQTAQFFAIASRAQAVAYLAHPILGPRLLECTRLVLDASAQTADALFGAVDAVKFRSCMTLFAAIAPNETVFIQALQRYFKAETDPATLVLLDRKED
jgi:uncharacterized protein (DUF1810 family)